MVALTPKAFAVLHRLVEDGGQLVSKEELLRAGWAKTHVSDGVLKAIILEIRRALGDDTAAPRFIETVPRRGYRFIAPRTRAAGYRRRRRRTALWWVATACSRSSKSGSRARKPASARSCFSPARRASGRPRCSMHFGGARLPIRTC